MKYSAVIVAVVVAAIIVIAVFSMLQSSALRQHGPNATTPVNLQPEVGQKSSDSTATNDSSAANWLMYHRDLAHTGSIPSASKTTIRPDWTSESLDGQVYAEPLIEGNSVFVATENNSIYSLDVKTGSIHWRLHIGAPVPGESLPCGNIDPSGITSTPVIDNVSGTLYAVAFLNSSPPKHYLASVDISTGQGKGVTPIDPPGADPAVEQQRAALTFSDGTVYVPFGGLFGDCGDYHGYVVGKNSTGTTFVYQIPTKREGGFWAPSGAVVDGSGNLYITAGNGESAIDFDHGNSLVKLSPTLKELGYFAPPNWSGLNVADADLGSTGPAFIGSGMLFQIGKEGIGYLVNSTSPGGIGGQVYRDHVCKSGFGGTAYSSPILFVPCTDGLYALKVNHSSFREIWHSSDFFAGPPIVAAGLVWTVDMSGTLYAFGVADGHQVFKYDLGEVPHFVTPAAAGNERLFVASDGNRIISFSVS